MSALVATPAGPVAGGGDFRGRAWVTTPSRRRGLVVADRFLGVRELGRLGALASGPSSATTSFTPYREPTTRSASSSGSFESTVSFTAVPLGSPLAQSRTGESFPRYKPERAWCDEFEEAM